MNDDAGLNDLDADSGDSEPPESGPPASGPAGPGDTATSHQPASTPEATALSTPTTQPRRTVRRASMIVGVIVIGLVVVFVVTSRSGDGSGGSSPLVGKSAPALSGLTATGSEVSIDQFRGRWVVLNFFATWCPPCVREHPELVAFNERAVDAGDAVVVSVAYQEKPEKIITFFEENGGDWPVIVEGADVPTLDYGVRALPESFLIDPDGIVAKKFTGGVTATELTDAIETAGSAG